MCSNRNVDPQRKPIFSFNYNNIYQILAYECDHLFTFTMYCAVQMLDAGSGCNNHNKALNLLRHYLRLNTLIKLLFSSDLYLGVGF